MPFISAGDGDLKTAFVSDAWLLDRFVGNTMFCAGLGTSGQLGDNTIVSKSSLVQTVALGITWASLASSSCATNFTGAIKNDGTLWMWGVNTYGQLGINAVASRSSPVQTVAFGTAWKQMACGLYHTAAIKTDGTLWSWGRNNTAQLGDNTSTAARSSPVQTVAYGNSWKQVSCGGQFTAAIKTDGTLWMWGQNTYGQLGDNSATNRSSPVQTITFATNWKQVSCGSAHTAAIKTDGTLWSWGYGGVGNLGNNTVLDRSSPVQTIAFGTNWKQITCGGLNTAAIKTDGTLWQWGDRNALGDNAFTYRSSPVQTVTYATNWKQVGCGYWNVSAIKTDGTLWTWGLNTNGELGDSSTTARSSPVQTSAYGNNWKQATGCGKNLMIAITYADI